MKKLFIAIAALCLLATPVLAAGEPELKTDDSKYSYIVGQSIGAQIKQNNISIDQEAFFLGVKDGIAGKEPRIDKKEAERVVNVFRMKAMMEAQKKAAEMAKKNEEAGKKYREEFKKKAGVKETKSGILYRVIKPGTGKQPTVADTVTTHYVGKLIDGKEFDSSVKRGQPATFPLNGVIPGWQEIVPMMKEGGKWEVVIPPAMAYGARGAGKVIGPNATLSFELELIKVEAPKPDEKTEKAPEKKTEKEPAKKAAKEVKKPAEKKQ
jgi:FKBP-type peptidyl-prolyl cis-trans isomerase